MKTTRSTCHQQSGASLIEVLVAVLILSFGMLSLGAMLSFSVQMPKLSGYRSTATNIASDHIERIRANSGEFATGAYSSTLSYNESFDKDAIAATDCAYPACSSGQLATMDIQATRRAARILLPAGGMIVNCDGVCSSSNAYGRIWIVWQEPSSSVALTAASDYCPVEVTGSYPTGSHPAPRCLYVRFKV
jgi:type IV pilus assembly protein PilV